MSTAAPNSKRFAFRWQVRLRTLLLLTAAAAVWVAYFETEREKEAAQRQYDVMRPLARELIVDDPTQFAVVKMAEHWYDENIWEVYLPRPCKLFVATHEIDSSGFPTPAHEIKLSAGRRRLELRQERIRDKVWSITLKEDLAELLKFEESAEWDPGRGSTGGSEFAKSTQIAVDQKVTLFRRRFLVETSPGSASTPQGAANGLLMWLEAIPE